jgi:hypothetical protein
LTSSDWISVDEACNALIERRLDPFVGDHFLPAVQFAWRMVLASLVDDTLPARSLEPDKFKLSFESSKEAKSFELGPEGRIPNLFWHHFADAEERERSEPLVSLSADFAEQDHDAFRFRLSAGIGDGGTISGEAHAVVVQRSELPGDLPGPRGRRPGDGYDDGPAMREFLTLRDRGVGQPEALRICADKMLGGGLLTSRVSRLLRKLQREGHVEKK